MGRHNKKRRGQAEDNSKESPKKTVECPDKPSNPTETKTAVSPEISKESTESKKESEWSDDQDGSSDDDRRSDCSRSYTEYSDDESDYDESDPDYIIWEGNIWQKLFQHHMKSMSAMRVWRRWRRMDGMCELTGMPMLCKKPTTWYTATLMQKRLDMPLSDDNFMIVCRFVSDIMTGDLLARNKTGGISLSTILTFCRLIGDGELPE